MRKLYKFFELNMNGRDFVVSDMHGCYQDFEDELNKVNFDKSVDRVFSVGDLCDRGPDSLKCLNLMFEDWFFTVMGNHEWLWSKAHDTFHQLNISPFRGRYGSIGDYQIFMGNGGSIVNDIPVAERLVKTIENLPIAIEVVNGRGNTGIIHAELPPSVDDWNHIRNLDNLDKKVKEEYEEHMLWGRSMRMYDDPDPTKDYSIYNIGQIYMGHTIVPKPIQMGNLNYIDTGSFLKYTKKRKYVTDKDLNPKVTLLEI